MLSIRDSNINHQFCNQTGGLSFQRLLLGVLTSFLFFSTEGGGTFNRTFVLEARTSERQTLGQMFYFPFIFFMYGLVTGNQKQQ